MSPSEAQLPTSLVKDGNPLIYTTRELNQQTSRVLNEIKKYEQPAFITKHGRFDFMIVPLQPGQIESRLLPQMAREIGKQLQNQMSDRPDPGPLEARPGAGSGSGPDWHDHPQPVGSATS